MTPEQTVLVERVRGLIAEEPVVREVSMFGGRSLMVSEKMIVSVRKDGGLLVRVDAGRHDELLGEPGAVQAQMGPGRDMGPGWIEVAADAVSDDEQLSFWIGIAMDCNRAMTGWTGMSTP
ncbi:TfoX/Sxy family protein [Microbacterium elymi]|uniref:TfoX/Sxy family protein n=1 Tax=Microbacterium elymi TaxID=2909587 RepID=A0ABY5NK61_9MICO|nr:TfoX/Sxy family protein [Microbacterium elymi]UUT35557.1 TfoX/Sxy family protein [Microbacterium elymi]